MRVLNAGQNYHIRGGSDRYLMSLDALLRAHGHEVIPFAPRHQENEPTPWAEFFPPPVSFEKPGPLDIARFLYSRPARKAIRRVIERQRPDVAHLHIYYGQLSASILGPLHDAGIPIVQTLHEFKTVCPMSSLYYQGQLCEACAGKHFWRALTRRCNRGSLARSALTTVEVYLARWLGSIDKLDHFIAVSDFLRDKVIALGLPADKVTTVHNFTDLTGIEPATTPGRYLLYFGRIERIKGIYTLLDAMAPLTDIELLIVGDGNERQAVQDHITRQGLHHVRLLGFKSGVDLAELIRGSICTVTPSQWYETFGLTLVESFAHGRPVIASRIGGMTEVVSDGEDGFLVPPGDVDALRERLVWMASHRHDALAMGQMGRRNAEARFSPQGHYEKLMDIYRKVGAL